MSQTKTIQVMESANPRWKDLYQLGGIAFIIAAVSSLISCQQVTQTVERHDGGTLQREGRLSTQPLASNTRRI